MAEAMHSEKGENSKAVEEMSRPVPNGRGEEEHELEDYPVPEDVDVTALPHISDREGKVAPYFERLCDSSTTVYGQCTYNWHWRGRFRFCLGFFRSVMIFQFL